MYIFIASFSMLFGVSLALEIVKSSPEFELMGESILASGLIITSALCLIADAISNNKQK